MGTTGEKLQKILDTKSAIKNAIISKGVSVSDTDTFASYANKIRSITSGQVAGDAYRTDRLLVWEDDFNGDTLDNTKWSPLVHEKNNNACYMTDEPDNVYIENSNLVIQAIKRNYNGSTKQWTSGWVNSNNLSEFQYGRIEAKIKLPKGQGVWPAFWTLGANNDWDYTNGQNTYEGFENLGDGWAACGEIDIMEFYNSSSHIECNMWTGDDTGNTYESLGKGTSQSIDVTEYHIYGMEWTPEKIEIYVDDKMIYTYTNLLPNFKQPHYLILNLAMGGQAGTISDNMDGCKMYVDWVRVYAPVENVGVTLDKSSLHILSTDNAKVKINATLQPLYGACYNKVLKWSSSDKSVARVYGGYIYPIAEGECDITCSTIDNNSATCHVIVGSLTNSYPITLNMSNCTCSNNNEIINNNASYTNTFTAMDNYSMASITVTMGGVDISSTAVIDNTINISEVTGDLVITARATLSTYTTLIQSSSIVGTKTGTLSGYTIESASDTATVTLSGTSGNYYFIGAVTSANTPNIWVTDRTLATLKSGESIKISFNAINPNGSLPAMRIEFVVNGTIMTENRTITNGLNELTYTASEDNTIINDICIKQTIQGATIGLQLVFDNGYVL